MGPGEGISERIVSKPVLFSIVGKKGAGKSEVLERLITLLTQRKLRVGVIKHLARDDFEIDEPGKDTFRYRAEGAERVMLAGSRRLALFANLAEEIPLENFLTFFEGFDLVFLEGYFQDEFPKIEVHRKELGERLLTERVQNVLAIVSNGVWEGGPPHFSFDQLGPLALFIEEKLLKKEMELTR